MGERERGHIVLLRLCVCLSVLTLWKSICPLQNCGQREEEASRWAGSQETAANTSRNKASAAKRTALGDLQYNRWFSPN